MQILTVNQGATVPLAMLAVALLILGAMMDPRVRGAATLAIVLGVIGVLVNQMGGG